MKYLKILLLALLFTNSSCQSSSQTDYFLEKSSILEAGFDIDIWNDTDLEIKKGNYGLMNSILVIHEDKLVLEKYYNDWSAEKLHHLKSTTKSITSLLIGIAYENNYIKSLDQKMVDLASTTPEKFNQLMQGELAAPLPGTGAAGDTTINNPALPQSKAEYDALPSGAYYMKNGKVKRKQ